MKPMILYVTKCDNDLIQISSIEFENYIRQAYQAGFEDGMKELTTAPTKPVYRTPEITPLPYIGDPPNWLHDYKVYCSSTELPMVYTIKGE